MEDTPTADETWRELVAGRPGWWSDDPIVRAAYENPTLRTLFPFPTHGTLKFYRKAQQPWPATRGEQLPFIVCAGPPYDVYAPGYGQLIGKAETAEKAVTLLVASLPDPGRPADGSAGGGVRR